MALVLRNSRLTLQSPGEDLALRAAVTSGGTPPASGELSWNEAGNWSVPLPVDLEGPAMLAPIGTTGEASLMATRQPLRETAGRKRKGYVELLSSACHGRAGGEHVSEGDHAPEEALTWTSPATFAPLRRAVRNDGPRRYPHSDAPAA